MTQSRDVFSFSDKAAKSQSTLGAGGDFGEWDGCHRVSQAVVLVVVVDCSLSPWECERK